MALADVIGHSINTHYPPMYGKGHLTYQTLNTTYSPCEAERTIAIMWTSTQWGVKGLWNPNHFVPVTATLYTDQMFQPAYHSSPIHAKIKVEPTMGASTVKEESLSEEPEHEPSVIDTIIQYQNTEQSVNDDSNGTLQQTRNTEESISDDPQEPRQELTRAQRVQGLPGPKVLAARDIFQKITEK